MSWAAIPAPPLADPVHGVLVLAVLGLATYTTYWATCRGLTWMFDIND